MVNPDSRHSRSHYAKLPLRLALAAVLMFGFGFALAPLYDVFCQITGINGKITRTGAIDGVVVIDNTRLIRVQLIGINNEGMPWSFAPEASEIQVYPGEQRLTHFQARNPTLREMVARAVPSVAPSEAAQYVHKVNCFCFEEQSLAGQASQQMPLVLMIDPQLPDHIRTITLSYTLFDISPLATRPAFGVHVETAVVRPTGTVSGSLNDAVASTVKETADVYFHAHYQQAAPRSSSQLGSFRAVRLRRRSL